MFLDGSQKVMTDNCKYENLKLDSNKDTNVLIDESYQAYSNTLLKNEINFKGKKLLLKTEKDLHTMKELGYEHIVSMKNDLGLRIYEKNRMIYVPLIEKIFNEDGELLINEDTLLVKAQTIINKYGGNVGLYFKDLRTQQEISINDNTFYPCSIIKVCVLVTVYNYIDQGLLEYDSCQTYLENMIIHSDNTSYNALISMLGNGDGIKGLQVVNTYMMQLGLQNTQLHHSLSPGDIYFSDNGSNISCPSDIGLLFDLLYQGKIISKVACDQMLNLLKQCSDQRAIWQGLPNTVEFAHKSGWAYDLYLDGGIVYIPDKDYILVLFTDQISNKTDFFKEISSLFYTYETILFTLE